MLAKEAIFDPKNPGPMKVVVECGNAQYYRTQAVMLIKESETTPKGTPKYHDLLNKAIQLLLLARLSV